mmetsp:Transcript_22992/g.58652  ORF Transcript_22992/g.58652 Transcript_22992/m.58652 type:complete len:633 (+) Transcript_22992:181-2079(+)
MYNKKDIDPLEMDWGEEPDSVERRRTDSFCCLLWFVLVVGLGYVFHDAWTRGDLRAYEGLAVRDPSAPDADATRCGRSESGANHSYLYYCWDEGGDMGIEEPKAVLCVESCQEAYEQVGASRGCLPYKSYDYGGELCMPEDASISQRVVDFTFHDGLVGKLFAEAAELHQSRFPIEVSAVVSALLPLVLVSIGSAEAGNLVKYGFFLSWLTPAVLGCYLILAAEFPEWGHLRYLSAGDPWRDFLHGVLSLLFALTLFLIYKLNIEHTEISVKSTQAACEVLDDMSGGKLMMGVLSVTTLGVVYGWFLGLLNLLTLADVDRDRPAAPEETNPLLEALNGSWHHLTDLEWGYLLFFAFAGVWLYNFVVALASFITAFATEEWFFKYMKKTMSEQEGFSSAASAALKYHLGSMTAGALLTTTFGVPSFMIQVVSAPTTTPVIGEEAQEGCSCCLDCYSDWLQYIGNNAYMDVAMNANAYWTASKQTQAIVESESTAAATLMQAVWTVQFALIATCGTVSGIVCWLVMLNSSGYHDPHSLKFVMDPFVHVAIAYGVGVMVAAPAVLMLHQVSNSLLFCFALDYLRNPGAWGSLKSMVVASAAWLCVSEEPMSEPDKMDFFQTRMAVRALLQLAKRV